MPTVCNPHHVRRPLSGCHRLTPLTLVGLSTAIAVIAGCAPTISVTRNRSADMPPTVKCPVFVMWPTSAADAFGGNIAVSVRDVELTLANRILEVVRERCADGDLVRSDFSTPFATFSGRLAAFRTTGLTPFEQTAALCARERHANYLVVPTIQQWNENRTDDPIGSFMPPKNRIDVSLQLVRLDSPAITGRVRFTNRARITLNQRAARLLNDDFRKAVRDLLWNSGTGAASNP